MEKWLVIPVTYKLKIDYKIKKDERGMGAMDKFRKKLESKEIEDKDLPLFLAVLKEVARTNEDLQDELEDAEDMVVQFIVHGVVQVYIEIKGGKFSVKEGIKDGAGIILELTEVECKGIITGETDIVSLILYGKRNEN
jgi:hypothetical protein